MNKQILCLMAAFLTFTSVAMASGDGPGNSVNPQMTEGQIPGCSNNPALMFCMAAVSFLSISPSDVASIEYTPAQDEVKGTVKLANGTEQQLNFGNPCAGQGKYDVVTNLNLTGLCPSNPLLPADFVLHIKDNN